MLHEEQEKLQRLLSEAIPMLCKNGITFNTEFAIEALVGITVDKDRVVLVRVNETVRLDVPAADHPVSTNGTSKAQRHRRKRHPPSYHPAVAQCEDQHFETVVPKTEPLENGLNCVEGEGSKEDFMEDMNSAYHPPFIWTVQQENPLPTQVSPESQVTRHFSDVPVSQSPVKVESFEIPDKPPKRPSWFRGIPLQEDVHFKVVYSDDIASQPRHLCLICKQRSTARQDAIKEHIVACHFGQALFTCKLCARRFKHSSSLAAHKRRCMMRNVVLRDTSFAQPGHAAPVAGGFT